MSSFFGRPQDPEVSDLIVSHDPQTLQRLPVSKQMVLERFANNRRAASVVRAIPESAGYLDSRAVDRLLLKVHWEMQRLSEEFHHGARVLELLQPVIAAVRSQSPQATLRVVDVGCGTGFVIRWLTANSKLTQENVELAGVDLNSTLINEAERLRQLEGLPCKFSQGDAFSRQYGGNIYISTGVLHHFRDAALREFFRRQSLPDTKAFLHYDFQSSPLAPIGSWFFHILRMRTALARHDGVLSAVRTHAAATLLEDARNGAPEFVCGIYGSRIWRTPLPRVFHTVLGIRRELIPALLASLKHRRSRLGELR